MNMLVVSIYGNPSYRHYEYTVQAVLVRTYKNGTEEQEELEEVEAHTEESAREMAKIFVDTYSCMAEDVWERF